MIPTIPNRKPDRDLNRLHHFFGGELFSTWGGGVFLGSRYVIRILDLPKVFL